MSVCGIDELTFGVLDLELCSRFFTDWGLHLVGEEDGGLRRVFETLDGGRVVAALPSAPGLPAGLEDDPTLREVVWGVESAEDLRRYRDAIADQPGFFDEGGRIGCLDPNGLAVRLQVTRRRPVKVACAQTNTWNERPRVNAPSPAYDHAVPIEVGHIVFFVGDLAATSAFYRERLGFALSDRYPERGHFLRCAPEGGHHDMFLLEPPTHRRGLNHVAFTVRDLHEVVGGGMAMSRKGWTTELGPGRHPVSSAMFWYLHSPAGALWEYYTDEDQLTAAWQPRDFTPGPDVFAEWAVKGGLDGVTRRQAHAEAPAQRFMTDLPKPSPASTSNTAPVLTTHSEAQP